MAMGSGGMAGKAASAEVPLGHGVDSRGGAQRWPGAGKRARRRARQHAKRRFHRALELAGNDGRGRRARQVRFLGILQLDESRKAADQDLARLREEVRSATTRADEGIKAVSRRVTIQAQLSDVRFRSVGASYAGVGRLPVESTSMDEGCREGQGDDDVQEPEEQEPLEFSDDVSDDCVDDVEELHEQGSITSVDMASSASMDGADLEDFDAPERSKFLLWCAREMKEMM